MIIGKFHEKLITALLIIMFNSVIADPLDDFSTDGCSQFPDGTLANKNLWCECCITHDIAYWQGGNQEQKKQADQALRECVLQKTDNKLLANTMFYGVKIGGSPKLPMWYRWGYGWQYGRGYQPLNLLEKKQVEDKLQAYWLDSSHQSKAFCDFEHPLSIKLKASWYRLMNKLE